MEIIGGLATVVGLVIGVMTLINLLFDDDPPTLNGELQAVATRHDVSLREYIAMVPEANGEFTDAQLAVLGTLVSARVRLQGYKDREIPLRWTTYDAATGQPIGGERYTNKTGQVFKPRADDRVGRARLWAPNPEKPGVYFIRVELFDDDEQFLDERDTEEFEVV
jgi:hypothetical protein